MAKTPEDVLKNLLRDEESEDIIRKLRGQKKWRLYSKEKHKNLGTFPSKKKAIKHEQDVNYFKHRW